MPGVAPGCFMKKSQPSNLELQVLSVLQVMEKKRLIRHDTEGNRHIYTPLVKQNEVLGSFLKGLVANLFGGSPASAMQHLLQTTPVSEAELKEMRALLEAHTKKR